MRILFSSQKIIYEKNQTTVDFSFCYVDKLTRSIKYHGKVEKRFVSMLWDCVLIDCDSVEAHKQGKEGLHDRTSLVNKGFIRVNCNSRTTCTNSSGVKPDLGSDQDQQWKINYKTNRKADRMAKNDKFNAQSPCSEEGYFCLNEILLGRSAFQLVLKDLLHNF